MFYSDIVENNLSLMKYEECLLSLLLILSYLFFKII